MLPEEAGILGCQPVPSMDNIVHSSLISQEKRFDELKESFLRTLLGLYSEYEHVKIKGFSLAIEKKIADFSVNSAYFRLGSIENVLKTFDNELDRIKSVADREREIHQEGKRMYEDILNAETTAPAGIDFNSFNEDESYEFIDSFYATVKNSSERDFLKFIKNSHNKDLAVKIKDDGVFSSYRIYCLKSELEGLYDKFSKAYTTNKKMGNETTGKIDYSAIKNNYMIFLTNMILECNDLYLHSVLFEAYCESLQRYGEPVAYKFKIFQVKDESLKRFLKGLNKELMTCERISYDSDEDVNFTYITIDINRAL